MSIDQALAQLEFSDKKGAKVIREVIAVFFNTPAFQKTLRSIPVTGSLEVFLLLWVFVFQVSLLGTHSNNILLLQSCNVLG